MTATPNISGERTAIFLRAIALALLALPAACGDGADERTSTTRLDSIELEPGTISDELMPLDTRDGASLAAAAANETATPMDDDGAAAPGNETADNDATDTTPPADAVALAPSEDDE